MRSKAAPAPDGLNAAFYKASWNWIKDDVYKVVTDFYDLGTIPTDVNQTYITLIPKKQQPIIPQDYRPIGLCNVIYKIYSKSVANRIEDHLSDYINQSQSAFVANRHISSDIILTQEIIHSFNLKSWTDQAFILKIDLAKAFNRIEWTFILSALKRVGSMTSSLTLFKLVLLHPLLLYLSMMNPPTISSLRGV
jgi:hypothetical protein